MHKKIVVVTLLIIFSISLLADWTDMHKVFASDGTTDDRFGLAVAIDGDYAVVGSYIDDNENGTDAGAAYIFHRNGTTWIEQQKLIASDGNSQDYFGASVSIDGDYAVIGATRGDGNNNDTGSAYVFIRNGSNWTEQTELTASYGYSGNQFGTVSISGSYILVGARNNDSHGSAYIFFREGTTWTEQVKITGSDGNNNDTFGQSVSLDGDYAIVGDHEILVYTGAAYIFHRSGTTWTEQAKLNGSDGTAWERFGLSVSISGDYAVVGSYMHDRGFANNGSAYVFHRSGTTWTEQTELLAYDGAGHDYFGSTVAISGDYVLVGAEGDDNENGTDAGSAYLFHNIGGTWSTESKLTASDGADNDYFSMVALSDNYALIGAFGDDSLQGSAYFLGPNSNFPAGQPTDVGGGTTIEPTVDLNNAVDQNIPSVPNGSFVAGYENVFSGTGFVDIVITTGYQYGAYYSEGSWHSEGNSGSQIEFFGINFDAKGDVPIILGDEDPLPVSLSSFTAIQTLGNFAQINWTTQSESDISGYNIYRNTIEQNETAIKINNELILGTNTTDEQNYSYLDEAVEINEYFYWLESVELSGITELFGPISINIEYQPDNPTPPTTVITGLHQNYPNPFNPETEIQFALDEPGKAELVIFNLKGQKVTTLFNGQVNTDEYINVKWNGTDEDNNKVSSGVYMYKLKTANKEYMKKMILMK